MATSNKNVTNGSKKFYNLAQAGKGRSDLMTKTLKPIALSLTCAALLLTLATSMMTTACDDAKNDSTNPATVTVDYSELNGYDVDPDGGVTSPDFSEWLASSDKLQYLLYKNGKLIDSGSFIDDTLDSILSLVWSDIKATDEDEYKIRFAGLPSTCAFIVDTGNNPVTSVPILDELPDGGLDPNALRLVVDQSCVDPEFPDLPDGGTGGDPSDNVKGDMDVVITDEGGTQLFEEDCDVFIGVGDTPSTPSEEAPETSEGIFFTGIPANTYTIKAECGILTGVSQATVYATSDYMEDDPTPFVQVIINVDEAPADGTFCTKAESYLIGTNQLWVDMSDQIGEYAGGFCVAYGAADLVDVVITLNDCPEQLDVVDQLTLEYTFPEVDGGVDGGSDDEIPETADCSMDVVNGADSVDDVDIGIRDHDIE